MSEQPAAEAELVPAEENLPVFRALYDPELDFQKLALESVYHARGFRLISKDWLRAVPFVIISVTYRPGFLRKIDGAEVEGDYITCEAVIADKETLDYPQVRQGYAEAHDGNLDLYVYPNEPVVFNDGGTGIRRSLTELISNLGMIDVGGKDKTSRRYDRPVSLWAKGAEEAQAGFTEFTTTGKPFRYMATRGLRKSEYDNPFGHGTSVTYYFG